MDTSKDNSEEYKINCLGHGYVGEQSESESLNYNVIIGYIKVQVEHRWTVNIDCGEIKMG